LEDCPAHEKDRVRNLENCRENGEVMTSRKEMKEKISALAK
jgi:hypothetical protein